MYAKFKKRIVASSFALAMIAMGDAVVAETASQDIIDARKETQIWTTFALSPYLRANDLKASVHNGKATLTGVVEEEVDKDLAKQIALGVDGITDVDNQILVQADYLPPQSTKRSFGDVIDDASITAAIKSKLLWSKYTDGLSTTVETKAGRVTLTGTADSGEAKELAERLALNTHGVIAVDNRLEVRKKPTVAETVKDSTQKVEQEISDSWITAKTKSTLLYSSHVDGSDITVNTDKGVVTLRGKVSSASERSLAIDLAKNVRGVKRVQANNLSAR